MRFFIFGCGFTEGVGSRRRQVWLYTKVAGGRLVWLLRGLHQKQSVGSALRKGFDGHVPVGVDGRSLAVCLLGGVSGACERHRHESCQSLRRVSRDDVQ